MAGQGRFQQLEVITECPLTQRTDLDHLFWMDDGDIAMQQELDIESYKEAKEKGYFVPKPRQGDVHKSLRGIRRLILKAHEYELLNGDDLRQLIRHFVDFLRAGDQELLRSELKKFLYVLMTDKKYAETIDADFSELFAQSLERSLERIPLSWGTFLKNTEPRDVYFALNEIFDDLVPTEDDGFSKKKIPELEAEIKEKYPHFFKIMYGENYCIFPSLRDEEEFLQKKHHRVDC